MKLRLRVWRQKDSHSPGRFEEYATDQASPDMSFLEMLDVVNEGLVGKGEEPIAFDHDCREGICGQCGIVINGSAHGPRRRRTIEGASTTSHADIRWLPRSPAAEHT